MTNEKITDQIISETQMGPVITLHRL